MEKPTNTNSLNKDHRTHTWSSSRTKNGRFKSWKFSTQLWRDDPFWLFFQTGSVSPIYKTYQLKQRIETKSSSSPGVPPIGLCREVLRFGFAHDPWWSLPLPWVVARQGFCSRRIFTWDWKELSLKVGWLYDQDKEFCLQGGPYYIILNMEWSTL